MALGGTLFEDILPACVRSSETTADRSVDLFPQEAAYISRAVAKRRREFETARACLREAVAELGLDPFPVVPKVSGEPSWPQSIVGSLTHCAGFRAAAIAWQSDVTALGIDAERNLALPHGVLDAIASPEEICGLNGLSKTGEIAWDRLLFSAKEAAYKAWFSVTKAKLEYHEVVVHLYGLGTFAAYVEPRAKDSLAGADLRLLVGRWSHTRQHLMTAVALTI